MNEGDNVREWLYLASEDFFSANHLYTTTYKKPLHIICYHCHQTVEKALKAYLCFKDLDIPKTHNLSILCDLCAKLDQEFLSLKLNVAKFDPYAVNVKYPDRIDITEPTAKIALKTAASAYDFVVKKLNLSNLPVIKHNNDEDSKFKP
ncbi:MAG: HEPN domain-containing protein [Deltaproteobacteria bacterium]|jgi:HEPN domain-containing protein|nr:HEPN domain-containing protein [Deltaproteobacteria bacterium]